jgi:carboxylesterase
MTRKDPSIFLHRGEVGVLLLHGLGGTPVEMKNVARHLAGCGSTVLCPTLAGHCGTEADLKATSWQDWYASAEKSLAALETQCSVVIVGGLSMGAVLAAMLAARKPQRVHGLLMFAPTLWYDGWSIPWYSFLLKFALISPLGYWYRFVEREPYGLKDEMLRRVLVQSMFSGESHMAGLEATPSLAVRELWRLVAALKPKLPSTRQPTLIVQAREDDIASLANVQYLQRRLGGLTESLILDDSYHLVTLDRQRRLVMARAAAFIDGVAERHWQSRQQEDGRDKAAAE